jgi:hypothetical protein
MKIYSVIFLIFLCIVIILAAGCTSQVEPAASIPALTSPPTTATLTAIATPSEIAITPTKTIEIPNITETTTPKVNSYSKVEPYVDSFKIEKNYLTYPLSNCVMKEIFPKIGNDLNYGLQARPSKLTGISWTEWNVFIKDYTEGKNEKSKTIGISRCVNPLPVSPNNPEWNFIKISAELTPGNAQPTNYQIVFHISSIAQGDICQIKMNETLYQDQKIRLETFIPMRNDEIDMFDTATLKFNQ